jgi:uncharacterized membrane protein HdeD (DUF308 family)
MKEFLGRIKADFLLSSVLCIALGLVFIIWRASVLTIVANVLAVVLIIIGVVYMCSYFLNIVTNGFSASIRRMDFVIFYFSSPTLIQNTITGLKQIIFRMHSCLHNYADMLVVLQTAFQR